MLTFGTHSCGWRPDDVGLDRGRKYVSYADDQSNKTDKAACLKRRQTFPVKNITIPVCWSTDAHDAVKMVDNMYPLMILTICLINFVFILGVLLASFQEVLFRIFGMAWCLTLYNTFINWWQLSIINCFNFILMPFNSSCILLSYIWCWYHIFVADCKHIPNSLDPGQEAQTEQFAFKKLFCDLPKYEYPTY